MILVRMAQLNRRKATLDGMRKQQPKSRINSGLYSARKDFIQAFSNPLFVNAFLRELDENGITYDLSDVEPLELPNIRLPWSI